MSATEPLVRVEYDGAVFYIPKSLQSVWLDGGSGAVVDAPPLADSKMDLSSDADCSRGHATPTPPLCLSTSDAAVVMSRDDDDERAAAVGAAPEDPNRLFRWSVWALTGVAVTCGLSAYRYRRS